MKKLIFILLSLSLNIGFSMAQTKISGVVVDEQNEPIIGASIIVKNTKIGTVTDIEGKFKLNIPSSTSTVVASFIGKTSVQVPISTNMRVVLSSSSTDLNTVVVVAYGSQTKRSTVGSMGIVDSKMLAERQITSATSAIQGNVAGVNVISGAGQPGENPTIRIRNISSINASADPLIVLDGSPFSGNINTISPNEVESITVLKDASSTSLYGSRAANGVILITTKKGQKSAPTVTVSISSGISNQAVKMYDLVGAEQYMKYSWEALRNSKLYPSSGTGTSESDASAYASANLINTLQYNPYGGFDQPIDVNGNVVAGAQLLWDTDWQKEIIRKNLRRNEYAITVSGGGDNTTYFASANYLNQDGAISNSNFERYTTRLKIDSKIKPWLSFGMNFGFSESNQDYPNQSGNSVSNSVNWVYSIANIYPIYQHDANGKLINDVNGKPVYDYGTGNSLYPNQYTNANRPLLKNNNILATSALDKNETKRTNINLTAYLQSEITDDLTFKTQIGYQKYFFNVYKYTNAVGGAGVSVNGRVYQIRDFEETLNLNYGLNYKKKIKLHTFGADLINEIYQYKYDSMSGGGTGFPAGVYVLDGSTLPETIGGYIAAEKLVSFLGRVSYNYDDRYFFEASARTDGSSRFHPDNRWGTFYSVGGSWIVSSEKFMKDVKAVSNLKLRASYGELGNNQGIGYYPYIQGFHTGQSEGSHIGVIAGNVVDPNLSWEKTASSNIGIDIGFIKQRFTASLDYYNKNSIDLIYAKPIPPSTGNISIMQNVGKLRNYGYELTLSSRNIDTDDWSWRTTLNFSIDKNEIVSIPEPFLNGNKRWEIGHSVYDFYMQEYAGVDPADGRAMWYKDVNDANKNVIGRETTKVYSEAGRYYQGSSLPSFIGGFSSNLRYKSFDLYMMFNYSLGGKIYDSQYASLMGSMQISEAGGQVAADIANRWQKPGDITDVPLLTAESNHFTQTSSRFLFDNDYLRLKSLSLGYNLDDRFAKKIGIQTLRIYLQGDNLLTFQSHKGLDPEQSLSGTTDNRSNQLKTISMGLNLKF